MKLQQVILILFVTVASALGSSAEEGIDGIQSKYLNMSQHHQNRIYNGNVENVGQRPYIVLLRIYKTNAVSTICVGSIISERLILTAAQCVTNAVRVVISYGSTKQNVNHYTVYVPACNVYTHKSYDPRYYLFDAALINTPPVKFSKVINNVRLVGRNYVENNSQSYTACGWSQTSWASQPSNDLRCGPIKLISRKYCTILFPHVAKHILCTEVQSYACPGDAGAPLAYANYLVGIASRINNCGTIGSSTYTPIAEIRDWITALTGI